MEATEQTETTAPQRETLPEIEGPRTVGSVTRRIKTPLAPEEKSQMCDRMIELIDRADLEETAAKDAAKEAREEVAALRDEASAIARVIKHGHETEHPCRIEMHFQSKERRVVRIDTGEVLESRAMTSEELQCELDFAAAEALSIPAGTTILDTHGEPGTALGWDDEQHADAIAAAFCQKLDLTTVADLAAADVAKRREGLVPCLWAGNEVTVENVADVKRAPVHAEQLDLDAAAEGDDADEGQTSEKKNGRKNGRAKK